MAQWVGPDEPVGSVAAVVVDGDGWRAGGSSDEVAGLVVALRLAAVHVAAVAPTADAVPPGADHLDDDEAVWAWLQEQACVAGIGPGLAAVLVGAGGGGTLGAAPRLRVVRLASPGRRGDLAGRLREQLAHVEAGRLSGIDHDPSWVVEVTRDDPDLVRVSASLGVVADGRVGTRGSLEEAEDDGTEGVMAAGAWTAQAVPRPLPCPVWTHVELAQVTAGQRWLDLRTGVLLREVEGPRPLTSLRFACLARAGVAALQLDGPVQGDGGAAVRLPDDLAGARGQESNSGPRAWASTVAGSTRVVAVGSQQVHRHGGRARVDRVASYLVEDAAAGRRAATSRLDAAERAGLPRLLAEQRQAWARRWQDADLAVDDDVSTTLAVRFAVHHLLASTAEEGEAPVGARGLSGPAYAGHVFWDAEVFVLPALAALRPDAARAMLAYRLARLPQAQAAAARHGYGGAWFPWESAATGDDVTPAQCLGADGTTVPVLTGRHALHITGDVAWAAWRYTTWTGQSEWLAGPGRPLVVEPARFWASRVEVDEDGTGHLRGVMGPDEYHGPVDDDLYTNVLARWNLRLAAELTADDPTPVVQAERQRWLDVADRLVVRGHPTGGGHEQFAGFSDLEPLVITALADVPVAADMLLGPERVARAQVVKQPDVLMAHHVLPDELPPDSLCADLDHEGPRLAHGSSLSPAIVAALLARAGRPDDALALFHLAARLDLDDLTGTTAAGLHLATMGGVWQALVGGFAGVDATPPALVVAPSLPSAWPGVRVTVRYRYVRVRVEARHDQVVVVTEGPVPVRFGASGAVEVVDGRVVRRPAPGPARGRQEVRS